MKIPLQILLLVVSLPSMAQNYGFVQDSLTKKPLPYVNIWVDNENIGATSESNGSFAIATEALNKTLVLSCVGYERKSVVFSENNQIIYLKQAVEALSEVVIQEQKNSIFNTISAFELENADSGFGIQLAPWIVGRYFPYDPEYEKTPYLNKIKLATRSNIKNAKFKMVLYVPDENGAPGSYLYDEDIIFTVPKGLEETTVDLSKFKIPFPENGLFIAFEWLTIEDNKFKFKMQDFGEKKYKKAYRYEPTLSAFMTPEYGNTWVYMNAKWQKFGALKQGKYDGMFNTLALETTLSN